MKIRLFSILVLSAAVLTLGCKKNSSETTIPGLSGLRMTDATPYVSLGTTLTFKANVSSITTTDKNDAGKVGVYWQVNSAKRDTLTRDITTGNPTFTYTADTAGTYTVTCSAYATGYYNSTATAKFQAIEPSTALTGIPGSATEIIEGQEYRIFTSGEDTWLGNNLYGTGHRFYGAPVLDTVFGNYYTWEEALAACPENWHLPSGEEFDSLGSEAGAFLVDASFMGKKMWEYWTGVNITNTLGFNAIPTGYMDLTYNINPETGLNEYAMWWTADEVNEDLASFRYIYQKNPVIQKGQGSKKSLALNVRCVKD